MTRRRPINAPPEPSEADVARAYAMRCRGLSIDRTAYESGLTVDQVRKHVPKLPWQTDRGKRLMAMRRLREVSGEQPGPALKDDRSVRKRAEIEAEVRRFFEKGAADA